MLIDSTPAGSGPTAFTSRQAWQIFGTLLFGTFVAIEAAAFQSPALAPITRHFGIPVSAAALVLLFYYLGATVFAPVMGGVADNIGRKRMVMIGLGVFAASEFLAALSPNFSFLLAMRFIQGLGVACILPVVLAAVSQLFPADRRGLPLGIMALAMSLGATTGALLAGLLIDSFGWPSIYLVSGAAALVGLLLVAIFVPKLEVGSSDRGIDVRGTFLLLLTLGGVLSVPTLAGNFGAGAWPTIAALLIGIGSAILLWLNSRGRASAVIDTALLKHREFVVPALIYMLHLLCYGGAIYSLAFIVSDRPGGSAADVGFVNLFVYGASSLAAPIAGRFVDRVDARYVLIAALLVMLLGLLAFAQIDADTPLGVIAAVACLLGLTTGSKTPAIMKIALGAVPPQRMGRGAGLLTMLRDIGVPAGSSFSLAIYGSTVGRRTEQEVFERATAAGLDQQWIPALHKLVATRGKQVDPALQEQLSARGLEVADLIQSSTAIAISGALPIVGYVLAGVMVVAIGMACTIRRSAPVGAAV